MRFNSGFKGLIWTLCSNFLYNFVRNKSHSKKKWARHDQKRILVLMWSTGYSCQILVKVVFSRQSFEKKKLTSNFVKIREVGAELSHEDGRRDGQTWRRQQSLFAISRTRLTWLVITLQFRTPDTRLNETVQSTELFVKSLHVISEDNRHATLHNTTQVIITITEQN